MVERFNKTLVNIVAVLIDAKRRQKDWDETLPYATHVLVHATGVYRGNAKYHDVGEGGQFT